MIKELWGKISFFWFLFILIFVGLFVSEVEASELKSWSTNQTRLTLDDHGTSSFTSWETSPYTFDNLSLPVKRVGFRVRSSDGLNYNNTYNFTFGFLPVPDSLSISRMEWTKNADQNLQENFTCNNWYVNNYNYYLTDCSFTPSSNYDNTDYLYITIFFSGNGGYVNSVRPYMFGYDERLGTNAVITNSANSIIYNNDTNTQNIINNQNQNTQQQIESQQVCKTERIDKTNCSSQNVYLNSSGAIISDNTYCITDYYNVSSIYKINTMGNAPSICFYKSDHTLISCTTNANVPVGNVSLPSDTYFARFSINQYYNQPQYDIKYCKNGNQALSDSINDDSIDDPSDMLSDMEDLLPNNGVITQLIGLPITLYTKILSNINGTCSSQNLGSLYGTNLIIPCIDVSSYLGSTLWTSIDLIISGAFVLIIARKMIKAFENFTSMKDGDVINND